MVKRFLLAAAVALLLGGCAVISKPCAESCPPGSVCVAGTCVPVVEPPAPPVVPPVVEPPAPPVVPPVVEPPAPPVVPPVVEPPAPPANPCGTKEADITENEAQTPAQLQSVVGSAIRSLPDPRGVDPGVTLSLLAERIRSLGFCAFAGSEAVFVRREGISLFEEYHAVYFGDGGWTDSGNGKYVGVHRLKSDPPDAPPAPPAVTDACPAEPCPLRVRADGKPAWKYNAKKHTMGNGDSTPVAVNQLSYCQSIGLGELNGGLRASCPVRPDGHPERVIVENWLLEGGPTRDSRNGQDCSPIHTGNPAAFLWGTGNCRMCNAPKTVCSDWL